MSMAAGAETLRLQVGEATVPAEPGPQLTAAIEAANERARIPGLADTLTPGRIDPEKAAGFVAGLKQQDAAVLARGVGHELSLGWPALGLLAAAPTRAADFTRPFTLVIDEIQGRHVLAHTSVPADPALARARAEEAQAALKVAEAEVKRVERAKAGEEIGPARRRREAVAKAFRMNAAAWAQASPGDKAAEQALEAAKAAVRAYERGSGAR